jgi:hypothetical protein
MDATVCYESNVMQLIQLNVEKDQTLVRILLDFRKRTSLLVATKLNKT